MISFEDAFRTLTGASGLPGFSPFNWQRRLFDRLATLDQSLPAALDLPTGLGKTSAMIVWLVARAVNPKLPRRLVYVVDRRAVVDQATEVAERIRENMPADLAAALGLGDGRRLAVSALRGRLADNREWLEDPSQPAIIVGTVDMIGSRLLFSGYGVSRGMRPVHAGLLGCDALLMLDEAHLSRPFQRLAMAIGAEAALWPDPAAPRLQVMALSATGADAGGTTADVFRLEADDLVDTEVTLRLSARKMLKIKDAAAPVPDLAAAAAAIMEAAETPQRLVVFVTGREEAVKIAAALAYPKNGVSGAGVHLLTGARRGAERDQVATRLAQAGFLAGAQRSDRHEILVATSAGEVGIDLDADHMVGDLVTWERMVQRFGRVNRRGRGDAGIVVLDFGAKGLGLAKDGQAAELVRRAETRILLEHLPGDDDGRDASPNGLASLAFPERIAAATTPEPLRPGLTLPLVEAWSLTGLADHAGRPDVAPWLRGWQHEEPQATLAWRRHLPVRRGEREPDHADPGLCARYFEAAPLGTAELLEVRASAALKVLKARAAALMDPKRAEPASGDAIGALLLGHDGELRATLTLAAMADGKIEGRYGERAAIALSGGRLVLSAHIGGLSDGLLSETAQAPPPTADAPESWASLLGVGSEDERIPAWRVRIRLAEEPPGVRLTFSMDQHMSASGVATDRLEILRTDARPAPSSPWLSASPVLLIDHAAAVEKEARRIADLLLGDPAEVDAVALAAALHDHGKASRRWQRRMGAPSGGIYAKTAGSGVGGLDGYRHEFGSLLAAEREELPEDTRDMILHLIAAHHGNARPGISISAVEAAEGGVFGQIAMPPSALARAALDVALRFARLQKRHGPWGLAWREEMLRAADRTASRHEAEAAHRADGEAA